MNKPIRKAVRCFIIDNNKVLAIKYKEPNKKAGWYDIPGGKIEKDEQPIQTAIREVFEETTLNVDKLERKGNLIVEYPDRIFDLEVFIAKLFDGTPADLQENSSEWIDIEELLSNNNILSNIQLLNKKYIHYLKDDNSDFKIHIYVDQDENIENIKVDNYSIKPSINVLHANKNHKDFLIYANKVIDQVNDMDKTNGLQLNIDKDYFCDNPKFQCLVAEADNKPVGMILYSYFYWASAGEVLWISQMYVEPEYRKKGIFFKLISKLREENKDMKIVSCATGENNERMQIILKYYGGVEMKNLKFYYKKV